MTTQYHTLYDISHQFFVFSRESKKKNKDREDEFVCNAENNLCYSMQFAVKYSIPFMQNLIRYIKDNLSNCSYVIDDNKKMDIVNFEEINITETWRNIKIKFGNININIMDNISLTFAGKQEKVFLVGAGKLENDLKYESICTFSDLMP